MQTRLRAFAALLSVSLVAAGCDRLDSTWRGDYRVGLAAPKSFMDKNYEQVDIVAALTDGKVPGKATDKSTEIEASKELQAAYTEFYRLANTRGGGAERRNQIQDELFRASDQRCNYYKAYLYHLQSTERSFFGGLSTALGGLGAIFTAASTARALSGAAGISSGVGAEIMEAQFASLTIQVLVEGIEKQRKDVYESARAQRFIADSVTKSQRLASLSEYTVEHAVLDAVRYHGACSITEGLRAAANSIQTIRHPGPELMQYAVAESLKLRAQLNGEQPKAAWSLGLGGGGISGGGSGTAAGFGGSDSIDIVPNVTTEIRITVLARRIADLKDRADKIAADSKNLGIADATVDNPKSKFDALVKRKLDELKHETDGTLFLNGKDGATKKAAAGYAKELQDLNVAVLQAMDDAARRVAAATLRLKFENFLQEIGDPFTRKEKELDEALDSFESSLTAGAKALAEKNKDAVEAALTAIGKTADKYPPTKPKP